MLGISAFYHDSAACLVQDGELVAACHEERYSRLKHDRAFPVRAIRTCLELSPGRVDAVAFYEKPLLKFERAMTTIAARGLRGRRAFVDQAAAWMSERLRVPEAVRALGIDAPVSYVEHHESHAGSAFFPSPFEAAAVLVADGVGEWTTNSVWLGDGARLTPLRELRFPHSLGLLYSAITEVLGFEILEDEYKVMGLAPYGEPRYAQALLEEVVDLKDDGSYRLNLDHFSFMDGVRTAAESLAETLGVSPRASEGAIEAQHRDLARSIQWLTEEVLLRQARFAMRETGLRRVCLAGGVALNCVANGRVLREGPIDAIYVQPASGDAGAAAGAAWVIAHQRCDVARLAGRDRMAGARLGRAFTEAEVTAALSEAGLVGERLEGEALTGRVARALASGAVVGWARGREEFGPRSLGGRSILADPRVPGMRDRVNEKIKFRESFRPFAPSVLSEAAEDWFAVGAPSPYMLLAGPARPDRALPATTHVDGSARVQTVDVDQSPDFHALITAFSSLTRCPVLLNTSFNLRGEPIVSSPADACNTFLSSGADMLVVGDWVVDRPDPAPAPRPRPKAQAPARPGRFTLGLVVPLAIGAGLAGLTHPRASAIMLAVLAALIGVAGLFAPHWVASMERRVRPATEAAARAQGRVLLTLIWALVLVPLGRIRAGARRALHTRRDPAAATYWLDARRPMPSPAQYDRMF